MTTHHNSKHYVIDVSRYTGDELDELFVFLSSMTANIRFDTNWMRRKIPNAGVVIVYVTDGKIKVDSYASISVKEEIDEGATEVIPDYKLFLDDSDSFEMMVSLGWLPFTDKEQTQ